MTQVSDQQDRVVLEPLYSLEVACEMIPMPTITALYQFLSRNKEQFPGRYRRSGGRGKVPIEQRLLTLSEIVRIREMTVHDKSESRFTRSGRPTGRFTNTTKVTPKQPKRTYTGSGPFAHVLRKAYA